jgi:putative oxidoreductase
MGFLKGWAPQILSIFRIIVALLFVEHGTAKFFQFPHVPMYDGVVLMSLPGIAGVLELIGGLLLAVGLFSSVTAFILSGEMAVAYFLAHAPQGFFPILNAGELAIIYCFVFLYLAAAGPGPWSVDAIREK